jgi:hypothetical protein
VQKVDILAALVVMQLSALPEPAQYFAPYISEVYRLGELQDTSAEMLKPASTACRPAPNISYHYHNARQLTGRLMEATSKVQRGASRSTTLTASAPVWRLTCSPGGAGSGTSSPQASPLCAACRGHGARQTL